MNGKNACAAEMANFQIDDSSVFFISGPWLNAAVNEFLKRSYWFPSGLIRKQEGLEFGFSKLCLVFGGNYFFCSSSAAADILSWLHSQRTIVFVLFWARALASSNLSRLVLSQVQTYPGSCSRKLKLIQARALASSYLSRPVLFSEKKKALLSLNFLFRNIFVQLEKLSALPIYFLIFDESVKFSNFFFTRMQENPVFHLRPIFLCSRFILARSFPANGTGCRKKIGAREWFIICWFFSFFRLSLDFH